jgi:rubredoxin
MTKLNAVLASKLSVGQRCSLCGRLYEQEGGHKEAERATDAEYEQYVAKQIADETQVVGLSVIGKVTKPTAAKAKHQGAAYLDVKSLRLANKAGMSTKDILEMLA